MKTYFVCATVALGSLATTAEAAVVTATLEIDPAGTWKLFAQASSGDNAGIAGFQVKLDNIATAQNLAPKAFSLNTSTFMGFTDARSGVDAIPANPISAGQHVTESASLLFDIGLQPGSIGGTLGLPTDVQPSWGYPIQLAAGTFSGSTLPSFASTDVAFNVFGPSRTGTDIDPATVSKVVSVVSAVPEPTSLGLLAVGATGLLRRVRRQSTAA